MSDRWAVVGGGLLGLTLAHRLAARGEEVTVIEAADSFGGLAAPWTVGDQVWDRHYHVTLLSDRRLRSLLEDLGLTDQLRWVETKTGVWADGHLHPVSNAVEFLRFPPLRLIDRLRLGATILYGSRIRRWERLEQVPVGDWLIRWSGQRTFDRFWLPLLRSKLGESWRDASAAFIWATIQRLFAARRSGLKKEMFGYVRGGYASVLDRFGAALAAQGVGLELGRPVSRVAPRPGGGLLVTAADGDERVFDRVVVTLAPPLALRIVEGLDAEEQRRLAEVRYQGIVCVSLLLRRSLSPYYLTYITEDSSPFTAVVEMTAMVDPRELGGHALVYLPKYVAPDDPLFDESDEVVGATFVAYLREIHPDLGDDDIVALRISRVREVFAVPTVGATGRRPPVVTSVPGLGLVSSANIVNGTLNVEETVAAADDALQAILRGVGPVAGEVVM